MENILINIGMYAIYVLLGLAILALIFFAIKQFAENIAKEKETLWGLLGLILVFVVSYLLSSPSDISPLAFEKTGTSYELSKIIGGGLISFYILFILAIFAIIGTESYRPFKK